MSGCYVEADFLDEQSWIQSRAQGRPVDEALVDSLLVERMQHILQSPTFAIRNYFKCVHKETSRLVLQEQFVGQTALGYAIDWQKRNGYAQRVISIKPRQVGWTQELIARGLHATFTPNSNSVIFMPDADVIKKQSPRVGTILNNVPDWLRPMIRIDNQTMWEFSNPNSKERGEDPGLGSTFTMTVPGGYRGAANINFVDFEEFAHWESSKGNPDEIMSAVMSGLGKHSNTCAVICSTANGHDQYYEPRVRDAIARNPKWCARWKKKGPWTREEIRNGALGEPDRPNTWIPIFSRWLDHSEYSTKDEYPDAHLPKLTKKELNALLHGRVGEEKIGTVEKYGGDEELMLMRDHGCSVYQLAWRRVAIDDADQPDWRSKLLWFHQEMATSPDDVFISYGRAPFSKIALDEIYRNQVKDPLCHGMLRKETTDGVVGIYMDTTWISQWGEIRVWALPSTEHRYIIAVDPASAYESEDADWTVAVVLRRHDEKQVAVYRTKAQMHDVEQQLALLYEWYNRPLLAVETDAAEGYGLSHNLYHHHNVRNQYFWKRLDTAFTKSTEYLGWQTDPKTRPVMQSTLVHAMAQLEEWVKADRPGTPPICIRDLETWRELSSCERDVYGKIAGVGDNHDDLMIAICIALAVNRDPDYGSPLLRVHEPERPRDAQALMQNYAVKFGSARKTNSPSMAEL